MSLKNAALLALIGMVLLTVLVAVNFVSNLLGLMRGIVPAITVFTSLVYLFTSVTLSLFFYIFHRKQS
ncbi:MAG TPA: hypothetical protein VKV95_07425 [Terriglobia bacterium]|nr:hypothetical protein [Terriglobia bacterium]